MYTCGNNKNNNHNNHNIEWLHSMFVNYHIWWLELSKIHTLFQVYLNPSYLLIYLEWSNNLYNFDGKENNDDLECNFFTCIYLESLCYMHFVDNYKYSKRELQGDPFLGLKSLHDIWGERPNLEAHSRVEDVVWNWLELHNFSTWIWNANNYPRVKDIQNTFFQS